MRINLTALALTAALIAPGLAQAAEPAASPAPAASAKPATSAAKTKAAYDVQETDLGTLLDDPVAKAILAKHIPEIISNPQIEMGRSMALGQLQQYASDQLTDDKLAKIQADLTAAKP